MSDNLHAVLAKVTEQRQVLEWQRELSATLVPLARTVVAESRAIREEAAKRRAEVAGYLP